MPRATVIDLSHHNTVSDLRLANDAGIEAVIHKATEGATYVDPMLYKRVAMVANAGMLIGYYHFLKPGDMQEQAQHFASVVSPNHPSRFVVAADYEDEAVTLTDLDLFLEWCDKLFNGRRTVVYGGGLLKNKLNNRPDPDLSSRRLWLAQYGPTMVLPPGFGSAWLWQYTDSGKVTGIDGHVDLNEFKGTDLSAEWENVPPPAASIPVTTDAFLASQANAPFLTAPTSVKPVVTVTIHAPDGVDVQIKRG